MSRLFQGRRELHLTKSLAAEWGARGVRVNAVAPTYINTPLTAFAKTNAVSMFDAWIDGTPIPFGEPDEIASVVLFLASNASSLLTGSIVQADGGYPRAHRLARPVRAQQLP